MPQTLTPDELETVMGARELGTKIQALLRDSGILDHHNPQQLIIALMLYTASCDCALADALGVPRDADSFGELALGCHRIVERAMAVASKVPSAP